VSDREIYYGDFERDGEDAVRNKLALGLYNEKKRALAEAWLTRRDQAKADAVWEAEMDLTRRATEAAESAASSAREANRIATKARSIAYACAWIAFASVILSFVAIVVGR